MQGVYVIPLLDTVLRRAILTLDQRSLAKLDRARERRGAYLEQVTASDRRDSVRLASFRNAVDTGSLRRHVSEAIARAQMLDDPAPMLLLDHLFPDAVYETMLAAIPPREAFAWDNSTKANYRTRKPAMPVPELTKAVWRHFDENLMPDTMAPAITQRYASYVATYYERLLGPVIGRQVAQLPLEATPARLMLRRRGYHLEPHLDPKRVLLTMLLYLARPGDSEKYGTTFYRVDGDLIREHATTYYPMQAGHRCHPVRVVPFKPNSGVVLLNSAAHGADLPITAPRNVERFSYQVYIGPPVQELTALLRQLPEADQRAWAKLLH